MIELIKPTTDLILHEDNILHDVIEDLQNTDAALSTSLPPDYTRQMIIRVTDRGGEAKELIEADSGFTSPFPQGIAVDPVTGEFLVTRAMFSAGASGPVYVHIYDQNFVFQKVVKAGAGYGEGLVVGYVGGERRIAVSATTGYSVYSLPPTASITGLNSATLLFTQSSANQEAQLSSYGNYASIRASHLADDRYIRRSVYSIYNLEEFLSTPDPVRVSFVHFPSDQMSSGQDTNFLVTKCQATCLSPRGMAAHNGQAWAASNPANTLPGYRLRFLEVSQGGDVLNNQLLHPKYVLDEYASKGWTRPAGGALDNIEPEGICYSNVHGYVWLTIVSERVFITTEYDPVKAKDLPADRVLDFRTATVPQSNNPGSTRMIAANAPIDDTAGTTLTTPDQIVDMMRARGLRTYSCTLKLGLTFGSVSFNGEFNLAEFKLIDGNQCAVTITLDRSTVHQFFASGNTPRNWSYGAVLLGGSATEQTNGRASMLQIAPNNFGQIRVVKGDTGVHTPMLFVSDQTSTVGSITMTGTATAYNTTSDVSLKIDEGEVPDALGQLHALAEAGAFRQARFKSGGAAYPMMMAQRLYQVAPYAVTVGTSETPWAVDNSKLVPLLFGIVQELHSELEALKKKVQSQ